MTTRDTPKREQRPPGLKLHPRTLPVNRAGAELQQYLWKFRDEKLLTPTEMLMILFDAESRLVTELLRRERHPRDPERKADEE